MTSRVRYRARVDEIDPGDRRAGAVLALLQAGPVALSEVIGHLDEDGLLDDLRDEGLDGGALEEALLDELIVTDELWHAPEGALALSAHLLDGLVLTHRLTAGELEAEEVTMTPDLVILDWDHASLDLAGGGSLHPVYGGQPVPGEDGSTFAGPDGWLDGFADGDLVSFARTGGVVRVDLVDEPADDEREVALLRRAVDARLRPGEGEEAVPFVLDALATDPGSFRTPVRPLGELLVAAGLERQGFSFGRAGERWSTVGDRVLANRREATIEGWRLERCCIRALAEVEAAYAAYPPDDPDEGLDAATVSRALGHGVVAGAFADMVLGTRSVGDERLSRFVEDLLVDVAPGRAAPVLLVGAIEANRRGDGLTAEAALRAAVSADPGYGLAAAELASFEVDRGDLARALTLLRHPDLSPSPATLRALEELRAEIGADHRGVGRNDPCPCGSGRKFKLCCQRNPNVPLTKRSKLLGYKLVRFAGQEHRRAELTGVAAMACDPDDPDPRATIRRMVADPVIVDFVVFEGGAGEDYLEERGPLLPPDELALVEQLLDEPRRLWELTGVREGVSLDLRDTATGRSVTVNEVTGSRGRAPGELMLARVARVGDEHQLFGAPIEIPLRLRESALLLVDDEPDADELAQWYGRALAPPRMVTREGEPLVLCQAEVSTGAPPEEVRAALDGVLRAEGDDRWVEVAELDGGERVFRGSVRLDGNLFLDATSEVPFERLLELVTEAVPGAEVVSDERADPRQLLSADNPLWADDPDPDDELELFDDDDPEVDPELVAAVEAFIIEREAAWVDESIPALAGLTPRQALDDPTRREDLLALLREMGDEPAAPGLGQGFSATRLRARLGLAPDRA